MPKDSKNMNDENDNVIKDKNINDEDYNNQNDTVNGENVYKDKQEINKEKFYEFLNNLDLSSIVGNLDLNNMDLGNFNIKDINAGKSGSSKLDLGNLNLDNLDLSSISNMIGNLGFINQLGTMFSGLNAINQPAYNRYRDKRIDLLAAFKPLVGQPQAQMIDTIIHLYTITKILRY